MIGIKLTERQRELFHQDKHTLVDMITILEHKLKKAEEDVKFTKNEMLLNEEGWRKSSETSQELSDKLENNKVVNRAMKDIEKHLDKAWEGNITSENFVETVTQIFTGDYYDKIREKSTSND